MTNIAGAGRGGHRRRQEAEQQRVHPRHQQGPGLPHNFQYQDMMGHCPIVSLFV